MKTVWKWVQIISRKRKENSYVFIDDESFLFAGKKLKKFYDQLRVGELVYVALVNPAIYSEVMLGAGKSSWRWYEEDTGAGMVIASWRLHLISGYCVKLKRGGSSMAMWLRWFSSCGEELVAKIQISSPDIVGFGIIRTESNRSLRFHILASIGRQRLIFAMRYRPGNIN